MSSNAYLVEANTRHQVFLLRRGAGLANEIIPEIERIIDDVAARVVNTPDQLARQRALLSELRSVLAAAYETVEQKAMQGLIELAEYEAGFQARLLDDAATASFAVPALEQIAAAVEVDLMNVEPGRQMTIRQALREFGDKKSSEIVQTISDGIVTQETNAQIAQRVQGLGVRQRNQADALVRTSANAAADTAKRRVYTENADLLQGERWTATLDGRTSAVCRARDGNIYPVGEGPRTPAHWQCRSLRIPVVREDLQIPGLEGERPINGADGPGVTSARTTYSGFLRNQPKEFQDDVLGPERAKLFRSGKVTLSDMVNQYGEPLTLEELKAKEGLTR